MRCYGASGYLGVQKRLEIKQNEHFSSIDFRIEYQFGYRKVVYRRLKKNENRLYALFACANFVFAGSYLPKAFHNINQEGSLPFYRKGSS